jgi:hypothetical protein
MRLSFDDKESFKEAAESLRFNNPPSELNSLQSVGSNMPHEKKGEDIYLNIPQVIHRMDSSSSSMPPQENIEST